MDITVRKLHVLIFPYMAHGHMIPLLDISKILGSKGVKITIITTPLNVHFYAKSVERARSSGIDMDIKVIKFFCQEAGLPQGCENTDSVLFSSTDTSLLLKFGKATTMLKEQVEQLIQDLQPDCLISDMFFPWTTDSAAKFGVPRLVFHGSSFISDCLTECIALYQPHKKVSSDTEAFIVPGIPDEISLTRNQLSDFIKMEEQEDKELSRFVKEAKEAEMKSFGVVFNSFYELERDYVDFYKNVMKKRAWHVGPVSLCNQGTEEKTERGLGAFIGEHQCLKWLDSKKPSSVIYICFGSLVKFTNAQLMEIANGLEASGQEFIWVVKKRVEEKEKEDWLPDGFEERMKEKGMIIRSWAPQVVILEHESVGGFVTHCGWNSTLEGICAGVPMVTWPIAAEQFFNEKLVTRVLKIGIPVGVEKWVMLTGDFVSRDKIAKAVKELLVGEEGQDKRRRAKQLAKMAKNAVENGGSSSSDLDALIQQLSSLRTNKGAAGDG